MMSINYTTWDGRFWQARWYENGNEGYFIHTRNGQSHKDRVINYLDWEGIRAGTRKNATEFQHAFFADDRFSEVFLTKLRVGLSNIGKKLPRSSLTMYLRLTINRQKKH